MQGILLKARTGKLRTSKENRNVIFIKLPNLLDLEQRIPDFPNCDNYGSLSANNPDPMLDDTPTNDNELHQVIL